MASSSVIAEGTTVRGNVRGRGSLDIHGHVEGDVEVDGNVSLGSSGGVQGQISGALLTIAGQVAGDLRGSEGVLLERGAKVIGDLTAPRIGIAEGALVRGHVRTEGEAPQRRSVPSLRRPKERPETKEVVAPQPPPAVPKSQKRSVSAASKKAKAKKKSPPPPVAPAVAKGVRGKKRRAKRR